MSDNKPFKLRIKLQFDTLDAFVEGFARYVSAGGLFIPISQAKHQPVGTLVRFQFLLADGNTALLGEGTIKQLQVPPSPRVGMLIKFKKLSRSSQEVVRQIVAHKKAKSKALSTSSEGLSGSSSFARSDQDPTTRHDPLSAQSLRPPTPERDNPTPFQLNAVESIARSQAYESSNSLGDLATRASDEPELTAAALQPPTPEAHASSVAQEPEPSEAKEAQLPSEPSEAEAPEPPEEPTIDAAQPEQHDEFPPTYQDLPGAEELGIDLPIAPEPVEEEGAYEAPLPEPPSLDEPSEPSEPEPAQEPNAFSFDDDFDLDLNSIMSEALLTPPAAPQSPSTIGQTEGGLQVMAYNKDSDLGEESMGLAAFSMAEEDDDIDGIFDGIFGGNDVDDAFDEMFTQDAPEPASEPSPPPPPVADPAASLEAPSDVPAPSAELESLLGAFDGGPSAKEDSSPMLSLGSMEAKAPEPVEEEDSLEDLLALARKDIEDSSKNEDDDLLGQLLGDKANIPNITADDVPTLPPPPNLEGPEKKKGGLFSSIFKKRSDS